MSEAYDMLLSQRHEAALERKIEAQAQTIAKLQDAIYRALRLGVSERVEKLLQDALEE